MVVRTLTKFFFLMLLSFSTLSAHAQIFHHSGHGQHAEWKILGRTQAGRTADHDIIVVPGPYDHFRKLKFKVTDAPLQMMRMLVRYDDGGRPENIETRFEIPQGGESRIIDLHGGRRKLKSVEFWYDTKGWLHGKADVILFGIK